MATEPDRFWAKVEKTDGCWLWKAGKDWDGYGIHNMPAASGFPRSVRAHRLSWEIYHGQSPGSALVCHTCDNPSCVRPEHLFLGTAKDNFHDCLAKGRYSPKGSGNAAAKLREADIPRIRRLHASGWSQQSIADDYGVAQGTISAIVRRLKWTHVPDNDARVSAAEDSHAA